MPQPQRGEGYWHTHGNQILDASANPVRIAGINWYGFETPQAAPGGLELQDYHTILATIRHNGYNTVRIPFSSQMVESPAIPIAIRFYQPRRPHQRRPPGPRLPPDSRQSHLRRRSAGLKVILDNHRSEAGTGTEANGLWYTDAYPESSWIADWQMLARRYANNPTVVGVDLRNEPATPTAAEPAGAAAATTTGNSPPSAPATPSSPSTRLLIFVEGIDVYEDDSYWWGGNLEGVAPRPSASPSPTSWSTPPTTTAQPSPVSPGSPVHHPRHPQRRLDQTLGLHQRPQHRPRLARRVRRPRSRSQAHPPPSADGDEMVQTLVQFLDDNPRINWTYWALNGDDRYGLLDGRYDATPWDNDKQQALASPAIPPNFPTEDNPTPSAEDKLATIQITAIRSIKR